MTFGDEQLDANTDVTAVPVTTTVREATINLICGGLGTGMLSLPWTMAGASVLPGILTIFCVVGINVFTISVLVEAAEKHKAFDLGSLLGKLPGLLGPLAQYVTNASIWFSMILTLIGYVISIRDAAVDIPLIGNSWLGQEQWQLAALAALVALPLCFVDQKYLSFSSVVAVLVNMNLLVVVCVLLGESAGSEKKGGTLCLFGFAKGSLTMISTVTNTIIVQMCVLPMYEVLENRSPRRFFRVLLISFGCLTLLLCIFCLAAYIAIGNTVDGNVLKSLPETTWNAVSRGGVILVILAVYPIFLLPMVAPLRSLDLRFFVRRNALDERTVLHSRTEHEQLKVLATSRRRWFINVITLAIIIVSFLGSLVLSNLGPLNAVNGAICVGVFTSFGPGLVGLFLVDRNSILWKLAMVSLLIFGAVSMGLGVVFSDKNFHEAMSKACMWHLGSTSMSAPSSAISSSTNLTAGFFFA
jgi:amino acid permease